MLISTWLAVVLGHPLTTQGQQVVIESLTAAPGAQVRVVARLSSGNQLVGGAQLDLILPVPVASVGIRTNGRPECSANPAIHRELSLFAFQPPGCDTGSCTAVRALIFGQQDFSPIPDRSELFTCVLNVRGDAPGGAYDLGIDRIVLSTPLGMRIPSATGLGGTLAITPPTPTPTFTTTRTSTPTATPTPTGTSIPEPTATMAQEPSATPVAEPCAGDCDGDGEVTIDEIVALVSIVLELSSASSCPPGDSNRDGFVTIDEVIGAVSRALDQC
jgi:hypothetical protein